MESAPGGQRLQAQSEALMALPSTGPQQLARPRLLAPGLSHAELPVASAALTDLQEEVEAFISENSIDERAASAFRGQPPFVVRAVMDIGSLTSASNPSAALTGRIKKAKEHIENVKLEVAAKVEAFLVEEDGIDERAAAQLRMQDPDIQLVVMDRGTLKTSNNPSAALMGRVKKALEPGGSVSRADIYLMRPLARAPAAAALPAPSPLVRPQNSVMVNPRASMPMQGSAMLNPRASMPMQGSAMVIPRATMPMQSAMLPLMAPGSLQGGYSSALMGSFGSMNGNSQFAVGAMAGMRGFMGEGMTSLPWYGANVAQAANGFARPAPY